MSNPISGLMKRISGSSTNHHGGGSGGGGSGTMSTKESIVRRIHNSISSTFSVGSSRGGSSSFGHDNKTEYLLDRLGGMTALAAIVQEFCRRNMEDPRLRRFFVGVDPRLLTAHQKKFFAMAFTTIELNDGQDIILRRHESLFELGLNESHFDIVLGHLEETLRDRGFVDVIVQEAISVVAPLREVFRLGLRVS